MKTVFEFDDVSIASLGDISRILELRQLIFVQEQNIPLEEELDEDDAVAMHVYIDFNDQIIACGRIVFDNDSHCARIGRIAVEKGHRRKGAASMICKKLIQIAENCGYELLILNSQSYVTGLYQKLGFVAYGKPFLDAGIEHIQMRLNVCSEKGCQNKDNNIYNSCNLC